MANFALSIDKFYDMNIGDRIPEILGHDQDGHEVKRDDYAGRKVILYFYPKDNTPGCTSEACSLRDNMPALEAEGYAVIGVSPDSAASHQRFIAKQQLPFTLIADTDHKLAEQMGVWGEKKMCGRTYMGILRTTFVVDSEGVITRILGPKEIKVKEHALQILG